MFHQSTDSWLVVILIFPTFSLFPYISNTFLPSQTSIEMPPSASLPYLEDNLEETVLSPAPQNCIVRCRISRDKKGMDRGMYPTYYLHMERHDQKDCFLLAGRKRRRHSTSNYLISCDATDLTRGGDGFVGKVRANFVGSQFNIYDNGPSPKAGQSNDQSRRELAGVVYVSWNRTQTDIGGLETEQKFASFVVAELFGFSEREERVINFLPHMWCSLSVIILAS